MQVPGRAQLAGSEAGSSRFGRRRSRRVHHGCSCRSTLVDFPVVACGDSVRQKKALQSLVDAEGRLAGAHGVLEGVDKLLNEAVG